jgi:vancomycin resistance protein VanW
MSDSEQLLAPSLRRAAAMVLRQRKTALVEATRAAVREHVPLSIRIERKRLERYPCWLAEHAEMATARTTPKDRAAYIHLLASKTSPLQRGTGYGGAKQQAKEANVRRVAGLINGVRIGPGQVFSYHHVVGRPSLLRGFAPGPELREGKLSIGVGGGACQVTNMLFQLGLLSGLEVVERHRHGLDLFPDVGRNVPFGCGATVFYNMADLRLRNPHPRAIVWRLQVRDGQLIGALVSPSPPTDAYEVFETLHRFTQQGTCWQRENRIVRRTLPRDGVPCVDEEVVHNIATTAYTPQCLDAPKHDLRSEPVTWLPASDALRATDAV